MNVIGYIKENKDFTFAEKELNKIDILIMSSLMYLDFTRIVPNNSVSISLMDAATIYLSTYSKMDVSKLGFAQSGAYNILSKCYNTKRYKDIKLSNYRYITSLDTQFSALTFKVGNIKVIGFEGTDELISGWKEDAYLSFKFPVDAQKYAITYIKEVTSLLDGKIYLTGHSKGGNLALVAGMYAPAITRMKIRKIYSFDGPGLRKEEYNSLRYKRIKGKFYHIIPAHSLVGALLYQDTKEVIKSSKNNILAHDLNTWQIDNTDFVFCPRDKKSLLIEEKLNEYLASVSYEDQEMVVKTIFQEMEHFGLKTISDLFRFRKLLNVIKNIQNIDAKYKNILIEIVEIIINNYM